MHSSRCAKRAFIPISAALLLFGCARPRPVPEKYGLHIGTTHRAVLQRAIAITNTILGPSAVVTLRATDRERRGATVYLVRGAQLGDTEYCFVPQGESCVFVNDAAFDGAMHLFSGHAGSELSVPPEQLLALMLLHETGHLANHDGGSYTPPSRLALDDVTATMNVDKSRELRADAHAIRAIREAFTPGQPMPRFLAAGDLVRAVANISWNLSSRRAIDDFAANALRDQRLFLDEGYTHPNFELRFLIMNDQLQSTPESRALLADFVAGRQSTATPKSLLGIPSLMDAH
ncbi:MAG TPA: hypothetical protein VII75_10380 [Thermoanaerobaculia bacterium]|nr:hypothetical protein [Thermoanaerobaculia bacterium]